MKNTNSLAGHGVALLMLSVLLFGCRKNDDNISLRQSTPFQVISTLPFTDQQDAPYDGGLAALLDESVDTVRYAVAFQLWKGDSAIRGEVNIADSAITFSPQTQLEPSASYSVTLTISEKDGQSLPFDYSWHFGTKPADAYRMTQRSTHVTDFVRDGTRSMQIGPYLYSFGGWHVPEESFNDVYRGTGDLSTWEKLPNAPWHGRHVFGIGTLNGYTYVIGGDNLQNGFDIWRTADGVHWNLVSENLLNNRVYYGSTIHNGYIYIVGGSGFNDVVRSRDGIRWEQMADHVDFLKGEGFSGSLTSFNGRLWMVCGGTDGYGYGYIRKEIWSSLNGREWQREPDFPGSKRYYTDVIVWDNKLWVVGGYNFEEGNIASIWYMRPNGRWEEYKTPQDYIGRHATGLAVYNNSLAITCGNYHNDCWVIEKVK